MKGTEVMVGNCLVMSRGDKLQSRESNIQPMSDVAIMNIFNRKGEGNGKTGVPADSEADGDVFLLGREIHSAVECAVCDCPSSA